MRTRLEFFDAMYFGAVLAGADDWAKSRGTENIQFKKDAEFIAALKPKIILDVGCGRGELMAHVADLGRGSIKCVGVDPAAISAAYRRCTFNEFQVEDLCAATDNDFTVSDQPFGATGYDLVVARNLFECLDPDAIPRSPNAEVRRILDKMRGWLRSGGRILLRTEWGLGSWSKEAYEKNYQRWLAMGHARNLVPWEAGDDEGRMRIAEGKPFGGTPRNTIYKILTTANPWSFSATELAAKYFPEMQSHYDEGSDWLILQEP